MTDTDFNSPGGRVTMISSSTCSDAVPTPLRLPRAAHFLSPPRSRPFPCCDLQKPLFNLYSLGPPGASRGRGPAGWLRPITDSESSVSIRFVSGRFTHSELLHAIEFLFLVGLLFVFCCFCLFCSALPCGCSASVRLSGPGVPAATGVACWACPPASPVCGRT
jgi:hypothetical protein